MHESQSNDSSIGCFTHSCCTVEPLQQGNWFKKTAILVSVYHFQLTVKKQKTKKQTVPGGIFTPPG